MYPWKKRFQGVLDYLKCRKVKCRANLGKNWAKSTRYASFTFSLLYFLSILRSNQLEVQERITCSSKK